MLYKVSRIVVLCACLGLSAQAGTAQAFGPGSTYLGPTVGLGGIGSAGLALGGRFERGISRLEEFGAGTLGILVGVDYYSWSSSGTAGGGSWNSSVTYIPIGATANYHFRLENEKIDPFIGAGLGYSVVSSSCSVSGFDCGATSASAVYFIGRAGGQYHVNDRIGLYADVGAGAATFNVGAMWRLE